MNTLNSEQRQRRQLEGKVCETLTTADKNNTIELSIVVACIQSGGHKTI